MRKKFWIWGFLILLCPLVWRVHARIDSLRMADVENRELNFLPSGEVLKVVSLGYQELAADLIWIKAVQYLGEREGWPRDDLTFYNLLDRVTTLDPLYQIAYHAGGVCLSHFGKQYELSNQILFKGIRQMGDRLKDNKFGWWLPFLIGFNYFFYLGDFHLGAQYMAMASELPGSPQYLPGLTATLESKAGNPEAGIELLERLARQTQDKFTRRYLEETIKQKREKWLGEKRDRGDKN
jgi:hypothetical protein